MRAFLAIEMPDDIAADLRRLQADLPLRRPVARDNLHLTLVFLGDQPEARLAGLHDLLSGLGAPGVAIDFTGLDMFGGNRPRQVFATVRPDPGLVALQARLTRVAHSSGIAPERRRFVPHVTLGRDKPAGPDLARLRQAMAGLSGWRAGGFVARSVTLFQSTLAPAGARHAPLANYPLTG